MTKDIPQAAGQDGQESAVASKAQEARTEDATAKSDEELRHFVAARMAEQVDIGCSLTERCEHLAELPEGDRLGAINGAARMMRANAFAAQAFAKVARVERRQKTIVERIQPPVFKTADLNSSFESELERDLRLKMLRYMKLLADETFDPALKETQGAAAKETQGDDAKETSEDAAETP